MIFSYSELSFAFHKLFSFLTYFLFIVYKHNCDNNGLSLYTDLLYCLTNYDKNYDRLYGKVLISCHSSDSSATQTLSMMSDSHLAAILLPQHPVTALFVSGSQMSEVKGFSCSHEVFDDSQSVFLYYFLQRE